MTKGPIALLPNLKKLINLNYPGIKLSISEYAHGGEQDISGGLAQVDTLGIFGREGVFAASHWDREDNSPYIYGAMRLYTDYDGKGSSVGDTSVFAFTSDIEKTSIYAFTKSNDPLHLAVIAINKSEKTLRTRLNISNSYNHVQSFEIRTTANPKSVSSLNLGTGDEFTFPSPALSATLLIFRKL